jgi:transposase InsO family protein
VRGTNSLDRTVRGKTARLSGSTALQLEWAYRHTFPSNSERAGALAPWLTIYNTRRRHTALGGLPPTTDCHQRRDRAQLGG